MTKRELKIRVKELIAKSLSPKRINEMVDKIVLSGAIDLEKETSNYRLPKQVVCAISKQLFYDYSPLPGDKKQLREIGNIYRII